MAEFGKDFDWGEAVFPFDFEVLRDRIVDVYGKLDDLAHLNGSRHSPLELLHIDNEEEGVPRVITVEFRDMSSFILKVQDSQNTELDWHRCDLRKEEVRGRTPGRHLAIQLPPGESLVENVPGGLTQIDTMVFMARTLEDAHEYLMRSGRTTIAYDA
jgi:hypothetical protein